MKRALVILLALLTAAAPCGCAREEQGASREWSEEFVSYLTYANYDGSGAVYSGALNREKMVISSVQHLPIYKLETAQELKQFKTTFGEILTLDGRYDEVLSFNEATAEYDDGFFEQHALLLVYVAAGSGSYRYGVHSIACDGDSLCVHAEQTNEPEVGTTDMAGWLIVVEAPREKLEGVTQFDADLGNLAE